MLNLKKLDLNSKLFIREFVISQETTNVFYQIQTMEDFWRKFPDLTELILNNLEAKTLARSIEASRKITEIPKNKFLWIRKIK